MLENQMVIGAVATGLLAAVAGPPALLYIAGFTTAGVAAGSLAAAAQTSATAAGGLFALCQSAGVLGVATKTVVGVGAAAVAVAGAVSSLF